MHQLGSARACGQAPLLRGLAREGSLGGGAAVKITEIRVKLTDDPRSKLKAYCSVTFDDDYVVRDLKVIDGGKGPFVAMPSRKLADRCPRCSGKNHLRAAYCNNCGEELDSERAPKDQRGRARLHADLAHPINRECRIQLHTAIVNAVAAEVERAGQEGYTPSSFDDLDDVNDLVDEDYIDYLAGDVGKLSPRVEHGSEHCAEAGG